MLTFLPIEEIEAMASWQGEQLNKAKEILAYELTKLVHGSEEADKAQDTARSVFAGSGSSENMPSTVLADADFTDEKIGLLDIMVKGGLCASNGEARRLVQQGGVTLCDEKVSDVNLLLDKKFFENKDVVIKKGKKVYHRFLIG